MKARRVVVEIGSDPASGGRAAEGVRVAAGLAASPRLEVRVRVTGAARALLDGAAAGGWVDEDVIRQFLPGLLAAGRVGEFRGADAGDAILARF